MRKRVQAIVEDASLESSLFLFSQSEGCEENKWQNSCKKEEVGERFDQNLVRICNDFLALEGNCHHYDLSIRRNFPLHYCISSKYLHQIEAIVRLTHVSWDVRDISCWS